MRGRKIVNEVKGISQQPDHGEFVAHAKDFR